MKYPKQVYKRRRIRRIISKRERQEVKRMMAIIVDRYYSSLPSF